MVIHLSPCMNVYGSTADLERRLLLEEQASLEALGAADMLDVKSTARLNAVMEQLVRIDADSAGSSSF